MTEFDTIELVANELKNKLNSENDKIKIAILYAFNSSGKTRLSNLMSESEEIKTLCYNAYLEDLFKWNNDYYIFQIDPKSWIVKLINEQGIEKDIIENFSKFVNFKLEPSFNLAEGEISFKIASGDDTSQENIKISKGEESMFIWAIFHTLLETAIDALNTKKENRTTEAFDDLEYIIIDDPVSSIDDTLIIKMAVNLIEAISKSENKKLKFLITTHHALFYNILFNSIKRKEFKNNSLILSRKDKKLMLEKQGDSPFGYHFIVKDEIKKSINDNTIKKYHFNLFRGLLEKTSNFLGYNNWTDCLPEKDKKEFMRLINLYSHDRLSQLENKEINNESKELFKETFNDFITNFKWKISE